MPTPDATDKILEILEKSEASRVAFEREVHSELRVLREEGRRRGDQTEQKLANLTVAVGTALDGVRDLQQWRSNVTEQQRRKDSGFNRSVKSLTEEDAKHASDLAAVIITTQETRQIAEQTRAQVATLERAIKGEAPPVQMREDGSTPPARPELVDPTLVSVAEQNERGIVLAEQAATAAKKGERVSRAQLVFAGITLVTIVAQIVERLLAR
jgi:hypothetical protein